jgi:D-glycero-D-manno-heptose 1,7-bisphosphate phosphatase
VSSGAGRGAVYLDRDGTIIEDVGYLRQLDQVRLLPGTAAAIRRLNEAGLPVIVVTNQSGIARGIFTADDYQASERRVDELLEREGARIDAYYFCPHLPELTGPCDCRKPGVLLYRQAAERFGVDLEASWWVGDRIRDVLPAESFGARGILVGTGAGDAESTGEDARRYGRAADLGAAVSMILSDRLIPRERMRPRDLLEGSGPVG